MFENVQITKLENGVRVVSASVAHVESVSLGIWVGVGSRHESKPMGGASHFLEHLVFKGTETRSALDITRAIEGHGGYLNAFTQEESTCYFARVSYDHVWTAFDVLADIVLNPRLSAADIDRERQVILEEMMMYRDQPQHLVQEMLDEAVWPTHPLGRSIIGNEKTIGAMSREDLLRFKSGKYVPGNTVVTFSGKVDHDACAERVAAVMADAERRSMPRSTRFTGEMKGRRAMLTSKAIEQTHVALGIRLFGRLDRRRYTLKILNTVLGENMSSRLFQVVRERHGLAYSIHSASQLYTDTGMLEIAAGLDRHRVDKALALIFKELDRLRKRPIAASELKRARDYVIGQLRLGLESTMNQMMWMGENLLARGRVMDPEESIRAIEAVSAADVQKLATTFFRRKNMSLAMVAPKDSEMTEADLADYVKTF